jgi:hypothetical protein
MRSPIPASLLFFALISTIACHLALSQVSLTPSFESAWINLDPEWPAFALEERYAEGGWSFIQGVEFDVGEGPRRVGSLTVVRNIDSGIAHAMESLAAQSFLRQVLIDFRQEQYNLRVVLERVKIVGHQFEMPQAGVPIITERLTLQFEAISYLYSNPDLDEKGQAVYVEYDFDSDQGSAGEYTPREDDAPAESVSVARLEPLPSSSRNLRLSWPSIPGISYVVEFTPSLDQEFRPVAELQVRVGEEGRFAELFLDGDSGFYRVRER